MAENTTEKTTMEKTIEELKAQLKAAKEAASKCDSSTLAKVGKVGFGLAVVAGTVQGNQEQKINYKEEEYIIPETILDDINILFKLAIENQKEDDLIDLIDEFIFNTKKELRKK
jgi:hypothetical protein